MTAEECVVYALARVAEFSNYYPKARSLMYRRIGLRQQQLFQMASAVNQEYFGVCAIAQLTAGAANFNDITNPVYTPDAITRVVIEDHGTSTFTNGQEIDIVPLADADAGIAPRATLRNGLFEGVGTDLALVTSVKVSYARLPFPLGPNDGATALEVPAPHDELLVIDLTRWLAMAATDLDDAKRTGIITALASEEGPFLQSWVEQAKNYAPVRTRFGGPPQGVTESSA